MRIRILLPLLRVLVLAEACKSFSIKSKSWSFQGHDIAYEISRGLSRRQLGGQSGQGLQQPSNAQEVQGEALEDLAPILVDYSKEPIILLNGFGVGSFHQHRLIEEWFTDGTDQRDRLVYCIDYLGQGKSWPMDCDDGNSPNECGLIYSAETWIDQLTTFIEQVVLKNAKAQGGTATKVHLVGNSVGGHLAAHLAARRPDLVESICLLNPTPVWGLNLPGWSGVLPPPSIPRRIGRYLFDRIRDLGTIEQYLKAAYSNTKAFNTELMNQIRGCTLGNGGHAAFASILWSPPLQVPGIQKRKPDFKDCLRAVNCDVMLVFGKDDPWCKPAFAKAMMEALDKRLPGKVHRYIEIENAGHCPNHEAPKAVASILDAWIGSPTARDQSSLTIVHGRQAHHEAWATTHVEEKEASDIPVSFIDRLAVQFL